MVQMRVKKIIQVLSETGRAINRSLRTYNLSHPQYQSYDTRLHGASPRVPSQPQPPTLWATQPEPICHCLPQAASPQPPLHQGPSTVRICGPMWKSPTSHPRVVSSARGKCPFLIDRCHVASAGRSYCTSGSCYYRALFRFPEWQGRTRTRPACDQAGPQRKQRVGRWILYLLLSKAPPVFDISTRHATARPRSLTIFVDDSTTLLTSFSPSGYLGDLLQHMHTYCIALS